MKALNYLKRQLDTQTTALKEALQAEPGIKLYVMSLDNFRLFYNAKNVAEYDAFFKANYDLSVFK